MIRHITRRIRTFRRSVEAARRELRWHDRMAYEGPTWNGRQWNLAVRHSERLYRISCGQSPWVCTIQSRDDWSL